MSMNDPDIERTTTEGPATVRHEEIRIRGDGGNAAGWWIAALVALVAIVGLFFVFNTQSTTDADLQAARDTGRAEAMLDTATTDAQRAAAEASRASSEAASSVAAATRSATDAATDAAATAADRAASASDAARDTSDEVPQ